MSASRSFVQPFLFFLKVFPKHSTWMKSRKTICFPISAPMSAPCPQLLHLLLPWRQKRTQLSVTQPSTICWNGWRCNPVGDCWNDLVPKARSKAMVYKCGMCGLPLETRKGFWQIWVRVRYPGEFVAQGASTSPTRVRCEVLSDPSQSWLSEHIGERHPFFWHVAFMMLNRIFMLKYIRRDVDQARVYICPADTQSTFRD